MRRSTRCRPSCSGSRNAVEEILRRAAQVLGVLTQELGVAVAPALDEMVLERLELVPVSAERLLLVFNLRSGVVRTIFVEVPGRVAPETVQEVARMLNERLAGHTLQQIRATLPERLRDAGGADGGRELLNIFIAEARGDLRPRRTSRTRWCSGARRCWRSSPSSPPTRGCASCSG